MTCFSDLHDEPGENGGDHVVVGGVATAPRPPSDAGRFYYKVTRNARVERSTHTAPFRRLAVEIARRWCRFVAFVNDFELKRYLG